MRALSCGAALLLALVCGCGGVDVGTVMIKPYEVHVTRNNDFKPGDSTRFVIKLGVGTRVDTIVAWFGDLGDSAPAIACFEMDDGDYSVRVPIPDPIPPGAMLWMTIAAGSSTVTGAIAVK